MESLHRCRGVLLCDGNYTGCPYGNGHLKPLAGARDCPTCHGSGVEGIIATVLRHQSFGSPDCSGCLNGSVRGNQADIVCDECEAVVRTVPATELRRMLDELESALDMGTDMCPHCGKANLVSGFSTMVAYVCRECGESVNLG
jgi:hypothetical protein